MTHTIMFVFLLRVWCRDYRERVDKKKIKKKTKKRLVGEERDENLAIPRGEFTRTQISRRFDGGMCGKRLNSIGLARNFSWNGPSCAVLVSYVQIIYSYTKSNKSSSIDIRPPRTLWAKSPRVICRMLLEAAKQCEKKNEEAAKNLVHWNEIFWICLRF